MKIIHKNPYRIAGILSNAKEREQQKQKTRIKAFAKVGKEIKSDYDFQILESISRTEDSVNKAFSSIEQNQDRIFYALFWFINASPFDNTAIEYLKNGDKDPWTLNNAGYTFLREGSIDMAINFFSLNVKLFSNHANAYDSMGEAYMKNGQTVLAIENYEK